ncbi:MAG: Hsp20/alpha crystallin family protein [Candidatus Sumerlaeia bacterium]|nr:Hsp20/alpha crystallin family protein [Candidatus Sumerlaeia bacterium]
MKLIRYTPRNDFPLWRPFSELQGEINRLFSDVWRETPREAAGFLPAIDIVEKGDRLVIKADLPGVSKEDVQVTVHEGVLTIRGTRNHQDEVKDEGFRLFERATGSFARSIQLPVDVQTDKVSASYKDGVLTIEALKVPAAVPRTVEVQVN